MKAAFKLLALCVAALCATSASADDAYPNRPIKIILPFPPGGGTLIVAPTVAPKLGARSIGAKAGRCRWWWTTAPAATR